MIVRFLMHYLQICLFWYLNQFEVLIKILLHFDAEFDADHRATLIFLKSHSPLVSP